MQRYETYKDSGVKWLGEIPGHWEVKHLRNFLTIFSEKGYGNSQLLSVTREKGVILRDRDNKEENHNYVPDDLSGYKHLNVGDFVINKMKSWQGSYGVSDYEGIVSPAYFTCKLKGVNPKFFSRAIRSKVYVGFFMQYSKGIRVDQWDLDPSSMKDIPFVLPSEREQEAIANYLDTATAKIDAAIAQQQKMIDLLNERKQIIINRTVTRGLNPNVKMKDSGVEWIGEVPEHWKVLPIKQFKSSCKNSFVDGPFGSNLKSEHYIENGDVYVIESGMVTTGVFVRRNFKTISYSHFKTIQRSECKTGDIIIAKIGAKFGMAAELPNLGKKCVVSGNSLKLTLNQQLMLNSVFVYNMSLAKCRGGFIGLYQETAQPALSLGDLNNMCFPVPPIKEQKDIEIYLKEKLGMIETAVKAANKQISLLQERKQIIINEVVTGKVKVV